MIEVEYFLKENDLVLFMNISSVYFENITHHLKDLNIKKFITGAGEICEISNSVNNMYDTFIIEGEDKLIIEFETEEESFYFKMKYC